MTRRCCSSGCTLFGSASLLLASGALASCTTPPTAASAPEPRAPLTAVPDPEAGSPTSAAGTPYVWKNVPILGGGFVTGVIFSPLERDLIYARTDIGGAYRWQPAARSWVPLTDGLGRDEANYMGVESLAIHPTDPERVYLAVGTYTQDWAGNGAIFRSQDRGQSWQLSTMPFKMGGNENGRSNGERLAVDPNQPERLYFGSRHDGLWRSEDGAVTWKKVESFPNPGDTRGVGIAVVAFAPQKGKKGQPTPVIYAAVSNPEQSIFWSRDAGETWRAIPGQPTGFVPSHLELDAAGTVYVAYGNQPGPSDVTDGVVYRFSPEGGRWANITPLAPRASDKFGYGGLSANPKRTGHLLASSIDRWSMKDELWRSTDGGQSWQAVGQSGTWHSEGARYLNHSQDEASITHWIGDVDIDPFNPERATVVGGTGIFMTENLGSDSAVDWRFTNAGLEETAVLALATPPKGAPLLSGVGDICGFRHDLLDVPPARGAYSEPDCNGTTSLDFAEREPSFVVRVGSVWNQQPHGALSTDGGATWAPFASEPEGSASGGAIAVSSDGASLLWSRKGQTPAVSRDRGRSWSEARGVRASSPLPNWTQMDLKPAADRVDPSTLYIYDAQRGAFYVSHDGGGSFRATYTKLPTLADWQLSGASIRAAAGFAGHVWLTTGAELLRSKNSGATFERVAGVEESHALGMGQPAPGRDYPALYLAGQIAGKQAFYRSDDIAGSWVRLNTDTHQFGFVNLIAGDRQSFGRVYLGTSGRGVIYGVPGGSR